MSTYPSDGLKDHHERGRWCVEGRAGGHDAHQWQPVSFVFEVSGQMPDLDRGRVYCVCMRCHKHTYIKTTWANFWLPPFDFEEVADDE